MAHALDDNEISRLLDEFSDLSDDDSVIDPTYADKDDTISESKEPSRAEDQSPEEIQVPNIDDTISESKDLH